MSSQRACDVLRSVLTIAARRDWQRDRDLLREELRTYLTEDLLNGQYELARVSVEATFSDEQRKGNIAELIVWGSGIPDKAVLELTPSGWTLAAYWGQCTGCLGSGVLLGKPCTSCAGTGWGMRRS